MNQPRMASPETATVSSSSTVSGGPFGAAAPYRLRRAHHHRGLRNHRAPRTNGHSPNRRSIGGSRCHRCDGQNLNRLRAPPRGRHPSQNQHLGRAKFRLATPMPLGLIIALLMKSARLVLPASEPHLGVTAGQKRGQVSPGAIAEAVHRGDHKGCGLSVGLGFCRVSEFLSP